MKKLVLILTMCLSANAAFAGAGSSDPNLGKIKPPCPFATQSALTQSYSLPGSLPATGTNSVTQ